jgi:hypothetical protein
MSLHSAHNPDKPEYIQARLKANLIREQTISLKCILSRLTLKDAELDDVQRARAMVTIEGFVRNIYPFPQDLELGAIHKALEDPDIHKGVATVYKRAKAIYEQNEIFRRLRREVAEERAAAGRPNPNALDTLGWRAWGWDYKKKLLRSPVMTHHVWEFPELRVEHWETSDAVGGVAGIHARLLPMNWEIANPREHLPLNPKELCVTGIVERFDRYVLGEDGWRAEWVIIRKLLAQNQQLGFELERSYPDVEVIYYDYERYGAY